jgi:hypothetical protein
MGLHCTVFRGENAHAGVQQFIGAIRVALREYHCVIKKVFHSIHNLLLHHLSYLDFLQNLVWTWEAVETHGRNLAKSKLQFNQEVGRKL